MKLMDNVESVKKTHEGQLMSSNLSQMQKVQSLSQSSTSGARMMMKNKAAVLPPPMKKNFSELSSEIRRKADAGRFKRQRNRISMIDIDEVKQIESEKAQKAEGRKKSRMSKETNDSGPKKSPVNGQRLPIDKKQIAGQDVASFVDVNHNEKLILDYVDGFQLNAAEDGEFRMNTAILENARIESSLEGVQAPLRPSFLSSDSVIYSNTGEQEAVAQLASMNPQGYQIGGLMESTERGDPPPPFGFGFGDYTTQFGASLGENTQPENASRELTQHNSIRNPINR